MQTFCDLERQPENFPQKSSQIAKECLPQLLILSTSERAAFQVPATSVLKKIAACETCVMGISTLVADTLEHSRSKRVKALCVKIIFQGLKLQCMASDDAYLNLVSKCVRIALSDSGSDTRGFGRRLYKLLASVNSAAIKTYDSLKLALKKILRCLDRTRSMSQRLFKNNLVSFLMITRRIMIGLELVVWKEKNCKNSAAQEKARAPYVAIKRAMQTYSRKQTRLAR